MRISDWSSDVCSSDLDQMLDRQAIQDVVAYVRSLSDPSVAEGGNADAVAAGAEVFAENCAACHGDDGHGSTELGAPNLADGFWIYGGDRQSIYRTVYRGRRGHMPARSEEHTSELQSLMRISYAVFCLQKKQNDK